MYCFEAKETMDVSELNENFSDSMLFLHLLCEDHMSYLHNSEEKDEEKKRH